MNNVSAKDVMPLIIVANDKKSEQKQPVFIEYTPDYKRAHGLSNEVDLLRSPKSDEFNGVVGQPVCAMKMPTPQQAKEFIIFLPVLLEAGNQGLNKIFDIIDTWNNRKPKSGKDEAQSVQAMVLPEGLVEALSADGINPNA